MRLPRRPRPTTATPDQTAGLAALDTLAAIIHTTTPTGSPS